MHPLTVGIRVMIDGWPVWPDYSIAGKPRPDVAVAYPGYGPNHGFDFNVAVGMVGTRNVCVQAQNSGVYNNLNCRTINLSDGRTLPTNYRFLSFTHPRSRNVDPTLRAGYWISSGDASLINVAMGRWDIGYSNNRVDTFMSTTPKVIFNGTWLAPLVGVHHLARESVLTVVRGSA